MNEAVWMNRPFMTSFWTLPADQRSAVPWIPGGCTMPSGPGGAGNWCCGTGGGKREKEAGQKERDWKKWRRRERKQKEKEELITMVCWAPLATVLSALQTFFQSLQQLYEVSTGNTSVLLIRVLRRKWGHLPKVIQLVSSRAVIWTQDWLPNLALLTMMPWRKYILLLHCERGPLQTTAQAVLWLALGVFFFFLSFVFVDKSLTEGRSLNWIWLLSNIAHHIPCRASVPYMNQLEPFHLV